MKRPFSHLAIVGASARAAAESVVLSGRTTVAADLFADADLRQLCLVIQIEDYPAGLVDWLKQTDCDAWFYTGALENCPELVDELAEFRPLLGNSGDTLRGVRDPLLLQQTLHAVGLPFPETRRAEYGEALPEDWLAKSYSGSSGTSVSQAEVESRGYFQRRIQGTPGAAIFASETLLGVSRQLVGENWAGAREFQYCGSIAPWPLPPTAQSTLEEMGRVLCAEFELQGLYGVDFVFDGQDVWPVEVNPRYTASVEMIELAHGLQAIDWHLSTCTASGLPQLSPPEQRPTSTYLGKAIWFAKSPLTISEFASSWALTQRDLSDIPIAGTKIDVGDPVLTVRAEGWTADKTLVSLQQRIRELEHRFIQE